MSKTVRPKLSFMLASIPERKEKLTEVHHWSVPKRYRESVTALISNIHKARTERAF